MPVAEAARRLGISRQRVHALVGAGDLDAERVGGMLLVSPESLERRLAAKPAHNRPWSALTVWAALLLLDGDPSGMAQLDTQARSRLRKRLAMSGRLKTVAPQLARRARIVHLRGHNSVVARLREHGAASGVVAAEAHGLELLDAGAVADLYVPQARADELVERFRLQRVSAGEANVVLRAVEQGAWLLDGASVAPAAAVALDLAAEPDARERAAAAQLIRTVDASPVWRR